jgi:hypothetical protein
MTIRGGERLWQQIHICSILWLMSDGGFHKWQRKDMTARVRCMIKGSPDPVALFTWHLHKTRTHTNTATVRNWHISQVHITILCHHFYNWPEIFVKQSPSAHWCSAASVPMFTLFVSVCVCCFINILNTVDGWWLILFEILVRWYFSIIIVVIIFQ